MSERINGSTNSGGVFTTDDSVDLYSDRIQKPTLFPQERKAIERYFTDTGAAVLDVGCGVGRVSSLLHEQGYDVTGIDISEPLVTKGKSLFPELDLFVGDVRDSPFEAKTFDYVIFSYYGLDYVLPEVQRRRALREIRRILKPAGVLVFSSHNSWHPLVPLSVRDFAWGLKDVLNLYVRRRNHERLFSRYKIERVTLGDVEIYLSNPIHQWRQLRECGLTPVDIVGKRDDALRVFERDPHYVAKR